MDEAKPVKVAVCISGEPRMYNNTYESVLEYFNLLPEKYECDIFIHAWNTTSTARNYQDGRAEDERHRGKGGAICAAYRPAGRAGSRA